MTFVVHHGDCREVMATLDAESVDAVVCDPPYGLSFMGKGWDHGVPGVEFWTEAMRVAKPGAHLLAFGGTRTYHRLACAIEDAGWEIRDCVMWVHAQGFPKSLDVSKAIDKAAGAEREVVGYTNPSDPRQSGGGRPGYDEGCGRESIPLPITAPATDAARQWAGWGTALKPAWEPVIVARKPLAGTVAENVLRYGTGAINVDGGRVGTDGPRPLIESKSEASLHAFGSGLNGSRYAGTTSQGRWPANLIHDGSEEVVGLFPETTSGQPMNRLHTDPGRHVASGASGGGTYMHTGFGDSGSAARFFYCAKASKADRDEGLRGTCTVKYDVTNGGTSCQDVTTVLVALLRKAICGSTLKWHIAESGESIMGQCRSDCLSTIATAISRTTESKILNLLTPSLISESIADANCETVSGGSRAESAEPSRGCLPTTTPGNLEELVRGVRAAVSPMLYLISDAANWRPASNFHATVKPTALMRYLCKLVTPPDGVILDPFTGSGSTGKAAVLEGFNFIGIEREAEYVEIARARIGAAVLPLEATA